MNEHVGEMYENVFRTIKVLGKQIESIIVDITGYCHGNACDIFEKKTKSTVKVYR